MIDQFIAFSQDDTDINYGPDSIEGAARAMLTYDGFEYDIREEGGEFNLYVSRNSAASMLGARDKTEWPAYSASSEAGVYENVIKKGGVQGTYAMSEADCAAADAAALAEAE